MQSDKLREAFEAHVDGEGWDLQCMPSGGYYSTRTEDGLTMWRASRKAALSEVRAELERLYAELGEPLGGTYDSGQQTALDCFEGWVEQLMEQDA